MNHRNRTIAILASLTLVGTAYGCSSSSSGDDSSANPDGGGASGDGGGTGADGGGGSGDGGGSAQQYQGAIALGDSLGIGVFVKKTTASASCVTTSGGCTLYNCPIDDDAGEAPTYSAGDITITGGKLASPLVLSFEADGGAYSTTYATAPFAAGETLNVSAAGAEVTAFSAATGPGPSAITLTAPTGTGTPGFESYAIDTSQDLNVTWTGGAAGTQVVVMLSNVDDENTHLELQCPFDAAAGSGTIPTALLAQLGAPTNGVFEVTPSSTATTTSSNASVTLQLVTKGITGSWTKP